MKQNISFEKNGCQIASLAFMVLILVLLPFSSAHADNNEVYNRIIKSNTIRCGYYVWPPFMTKDVNTGEMGGLSKDIFDQIGKSLSLKIEWTAEIGLDVMFEGYKNGAYDMICAPLSAEPARARASDFTIPIFYGGYYVYARVHDQRFDNDYASINKKGIKVSTLEGDYGSILAREKFPNAQKIDVSQVGGNTNVLMDLVNKKADVALMEPATALEFMRTNPNKIRKVPGGPLSVGDLSFSIPQGEEKLKSMLNITLQTLLDVGAIDRVLKNYPDYDATFLRISPAYQLNKE